MDWFDFAEVIVLGAISSFIKNPATAKKYLPALLRLQDGVNKAVIAIQEVSGNPPAA